MKNIYYFILCCIIIFLLSCDYVDNPYPSSKIIVIPTAHIKKILIEDYTGHTCGNCPKAAKKLFTLDTTYPGHIIGIGIHAGSFALPTPGYSGSPQTAFLADYRTSIGNDYDATFGASAYGLPQGLFNRKDFNPVSKTHLKFYPNWLSYAAAIINEESVVDLHISSTYNVSTRNISCTIKDSFLTSQSENLKLVVLLTQDSIIDWQDNIGTIQSNYIHRHMLRDAITPSGAWGEILANGNIIIGSTHIKQYNYTLPLAFNTIPCDANKCHLVAFIYKTSNYEIIQSEETKIIP